MSHEKDGPTVEIPAPAQNRIGCAHMSLLPRSMHWDGQRWFAKLESDGSRWYLNDYDGVWVKRCEVN